jgi:hypothetical protein
MSRLETALLVELKKGLLDNRSGKIDTEAGVFEAPGSAKKPGQKCNNSSLTLIYSQKEPFSSMQCASRPWTISL